MRGMMKRGALALGVMLVLAIPTALWRTSATAPPVPGNPHLAIGVMYDEQAHTGQVTAVDEETGASLYHLKTAAQPDVAVSPNHDTIYLLETKWAPDQQSPTNTLSAIDTHTWNVTATAAVQDPIRYPGWGPSGLAVSPDGRWLYIYHYKVLGDDNADYWLTTVDARTLRPHGAPISTPRCGGAMFAATADRIVALCTKANQLLFIDPEAGKITATVTLPPTRPTEGEPVGLLVSPDKQKLYVGRNDSRIVEVAASGAGEPRMVKLGDVRPSYAIGMSQGGSQLMLATGYYGEVNFVYMIDPENMQIRDMVRLEPKERASLGADSPGYRVQEIGDGRAVLPRLTGNISLVFDGGRFVRLVR